jgi:hypothetical protein
MMPAAFIVCCLTAPLPDVLTFVPMKFVQREFSLYLLPYVQVVSLLVDQ